MQSELPLRIELTYGWVLFFGGDARLENFWISGKYCGAGKTNENFLENLPLTYTYYVYVGLVFLKYRKNFFQNLHQFF